MHILLQGEVALATVNKLLLLSISFWCILEIVEGVSLKRSFNPLRIMISVDDCVYLQEVIEPMVRWVKFEWQVAGIEPQIAVDVRRGCNDECAVVVRKLICERVVVPHLSGTADLVLRPRRRLKD